MTRNRKEPPKTAFGRKFSSHPDIVRQQVAEARQGGSGITIQQARAIAEELKANRRIWFTPPDPVEIAKAIHFKSLVMRCPDASRAPRTGQGCPTRT